MLTKETKVALANEQKVQAVGEKIFDSHITTILTQALLQQNDILDCLIVINLIEAPPTVEVKLASVLLSEVFSAKNHIAGAFSQRLVEQNRQIEALTVLVMALDKTVSMTVPGEYSPFGSWREAQAVARRAEEDEIANLHRNPDELKRRLKELKVVNSCFD